jgi:hypothetical protein
MKRTALALTLIMALLVSVLAGFFPFSKAASEAPKVEWSKTYGPVGAGSLVQTEDGGFVIAGGTATYSSEARGYINSAALLIKTNQSGDLEWEKVYGPDVSANSMVETIDFGYAMGGYHSLTKTDAQGDVLWNRTFDFLDIFRIIQASDGGYVLAGWGHNQSINTLYAVLLKTDDEGTLLWNTTFLGSELNQTTANALIETGDKGYAVAGNWGQSFWFAKTDSNGDLLWNHTYYCVNSGVSPLTFYSIAQTKDIGFILGGTDGRYGWLIKTNYQGIEEWNQRSNYSFRSIVQTTDCGYAGFADTVLVKLDILGNTQWSEFYDSSDNFTTPSPYPPSTSARWGIITHDGGFAVAGSRINPRGPERYVWVAKIAPESAIPSDSVAPQFSTMSIVVDVVAVVAIVGAGLLVYFKKRNRQAPKASSDKPETTGR